MAGGAVFGTALADRIESAFDGLSEQLRRAARFVSDNPAEVAMHSMRRVAGEAGVAPVTMLRLARRLGLEDYEALRGICRDLVRSNTQGSNTQGNPFTQRARALQSRGERGGGRDLLANLLHAEIGNLDRTLAGTEVARQVEAAADILLGARRIFVLGRRSCHPVAGFFFYTYRLFRSNAVLVDDRAGCFGHDLLEIGAADALLAISFEPYSAETITAVEAAGAAGAHIVAITDATLSPLGRAASVTLIAANASPAFLQSIVAAMALAQALVTDLFLRLGPPAVAALEGNEARLRERGAYWAAENGRGRPRRRGGAMPLPPGASGPAR